MLDRNMSLSDRAETYLGTIQLSLERETGHEWTKQEALDATLALAEMYSRDMLANLTEEEIEKLNAGDYTIPMKSRARRKKSGNGSKKIGTDGERDTGLIVDTSSDSGGLIGQFRS